MSRARDAKRWRWISMGSAHRSLWIPAVILLGMVMGIARAEGGLKVRPEAVGLRGPDAAQQLAVEDEDGRDRTAEARFESSDAGVVVVDPTGLVEPKGDGRSTIMVRVGGREATVEVSVKEFQPGPPIHFANQIVPIFTKLGCNAGGCHGKASGQNGFRLSLLGFEPDLDYETLVKEGRGRRLFPAAPEQSLLLLKATARVPHGGGRKLAPGSQEYRLIARWIAAGMPIGPADAPSVARIEVGPVARVLQGGAKQQLIVTAHYTDGSTEDVTHRAQYQTNEPEVASVGDGGRVEAGAVPGLAAIMARYQGQVAVFRATVPRAGTVEPYPDFPAANVIDELALKQWKALGIAPSEPCTDAEFIRRARLDLTGTLPTAAEARAFVADGDPQKRSSLIDRLLETPEYADHFATKWADVLRNQRGNDGQAQAVTYRFHAWIRDQLARNAPYDRFAREILAASGTPESAPAVAWYRHLRTPDAFVDDTAQVFLGMRLQCARCHHHPFEKWSQDDYYSFAAFFARVGRKPSPEGRRAGRMSEAIFNARTGAVGHPKTGKVMEPRGLGGPVVTVSVGDDPRQKLADWMADPANSYFARALVNRYWAHFFGRGICEPIDDLRVTNPPTNPDLLDALASGFVASHYDLKQLIRTITASRVYGLSSLPNETNARDRQSFARHYPKRMAAEVLLDAIAQVTDVPTGFNGLPAGTRAIELPDEVAGSSFLDIFGRPKRDTACECERVTDATLGQSLMLLNSGDVQGKLSAPGGRAAALAKDQGPDAENIADLFWSAFGRAPSQTEADRALAHLSENKDKRQQAFEDILWALINAKEFQFND